MPEKIHSQGRPTNLGWMLSCAGVHPEAVKIVEALQAKIADAPHGEDCVRFYGYPGCDCWKSEGPDAR